MILTHLTTIITLIVSLINHTNGQRGCNVQNLLPTSTTMDDFIVSLYINCDDNTVTVTIKYSKYNNNWFGIAFSSSPHISGSALIYTTGKSDETQRNEELYPYTMSSYEYSGVTYDGIENNWQKINATYENNIFVVEYKQDLNKTSFTRETETVSVRWAHGNGNSLILTQHDSNGRSDSTAKLDLLSGTSSQIVDNLSLQIIHGIIMWITWSVLTSVGIMSSSFRYLYPKGPKWFFVHRGILCVAVILNIVAFIIAIVFTEIKQKKHFDNPHMIIGLVVTVLAVLQPITVLFQPSGHGQGVKSTKRIVWEYIHNGSGYISWILALVTTMLGIQIIGEHVLAYIHIFLWCGLLLIAYIVLFVIGYVNKKKQLKNEMAVVNEEDLTASEHILDK